MVTFTVDGQPIPKARPRVGKYGTYTPSSTIQWETRVGWAARMFGVEPFPGDVAIRMAFRRKGKTRADIDNLVKACLDGLNGIAYADDRQVVQLSANVEYGVKFPGVTIEIQEAA